MKNLHAEITIETCLFSSCYIQFYNLTIEFNRFWGNSAP